MQITLEVDNTENNQPLIDALLAMYVCRDEVAIFGNIVSVKQIGDTYEFNLNQGV